MQKTTGIHSILSFPIVYESYQKLVGANRCWRVFSDEYVQPKDDERILDIGCGPANILNFLPEIDYLGLDISHSYLRKAQHNAHRRARFICGTTECLLQEHRQKFDIVLGIGLLHHLSDDESRGVFQSASQLLCRGGRIVTIDPCYTDDQNPVARFLARNDRGQNVRPHDSYAELAKPYFERIVSHVRHDMLNVPFTQCILQCYQA